MKRLACMVVAAWATLVLPAVADDAERPNDFVGLTPDELDYSPMASIPGASTALVLGHPGREGLYIMRYRVPANTLWAPHQQDQDRHLTVISGTWAFGQGRSGSCEDTQPMPAGSYIFQPADKPHFGGSCSDEPAEVQVMGVGPVGIFSPR